MMKNNELEFMSSSEVVSKEVIEGLMKNIIKELNTGESGIYTCEWTEENELSAYHDGLLLFVLNFDKEEKKQ